MEYLEKYNAMKFAIQECHSIDEIKLIRDKAEAYRYVLIQAKEAPEWIRQAEEIKLRAERKAGELLPEQITIGTKSHDVTLSNLGMFGVDTFDAILPPEQGSILAIGASKPHVVAISDKLFGIQKLRNDDLNLQTFD